MSSSGMSDEALRAALQAMPTPSPSTGMDARIARRLAQRSEPPMVWRALRFAVLAAACVIVLVIGGGLIRYGLVDGAPPPEVSFHASGPQVAATYWNRRMQEAMGGATR